MLIRSYLKGGNGEARKELLKNKIDWKEMGQVFALITQIYTIISRLCKELKVDLGILEWITTEGKEQFEMKLTELARRYLTSVRPLREKSGVDLYGDDLEPWPQHAFKKMHRLTKSTRVTLWKDGLRIRENEGNDQSPWRHFFLFPLPTGVGKLIGLTINEMLGVIGVPANHGLLEMLIRDQQMVPPDWGGMNSNGGQCIFVFFGSEYSIKDGCKDGCSVGETCYRGMVLDKASFTWLDNFYRLKDLEMLDGRVLAVYLTKIKH